MTPYLVCYAILVVALVTGLLLDKVRVAAVIAFVPMLVLILGRGLIGTDSAVYVQQFDVIRYRGFLAGGFEPGFSIIVEALTWVFPDPFDILILLGGATAITMFCAGLLLERSPLLFMTIILPFFMLDMTMNGLRYGLAFSIVALGAASLARGKTKAFIACCVLAASIQVSAVLLAVSVWALIEVRVKTFVGIAAGSVAALTLFGGYLEDKFSENAEITGLGGISGLVPLLATVAIVVAIRYNNRKIVDNQLALVAIVVMQLISFGISRYFYAGLRIQSLFLFLLYLFTAIMVRKSTFLIAKDRIFMMALTFTMGAATASRIKNFSDDIGGLSPFNPYYFSSELNG